MEDLAYIFKFYNLGATNTFPVAIYSSMCNQWYIGM